MVCLFLFFFPIYLLQKIAVWTTLKATEPVLKWSTRGSNGRTIKKAKRLDINSSPSDWRKAKPRLSQWKEKLTAGELLVFIGIVIRMGVLNKKRIGHYWSPREGYGDPIIMKSMKKPRFLMILAALSFAKPGSDPGWSKISYVDTILRAACAAAIGFTQHVAIDESMIKCLSRYCSWKQYMPKKPIKTGIKV